MFLSEKQSVQRLVERLWDQRSRFSRLVLILVWRRKVAVCCPGLPPWRCRGRDRVTKTPSPGLGCWQYYLSLTVIFPHQTVAWCGLKSPEMMRSVLKITLERLADWLDSELFVNIVSFRINVRNLSHLSLPALYFVSLRLETLRDCPYLTWVPREMRTRHRESNGEQKHDSENIFQIFQLSQRRAVVEGGAEYQAWKTIITVIRRSHWGAKYVELIRAPPDWRETHLLVVEGNVGFVLKMFSHWPGVRRDGELRYWDGNYVVSIIASTRERRAWLQ